MKKLLSITRYANAFAARTLDHIIHALHTKRRSQLIAVVSLSLCIGAFTASQLRNARFARQKWVATIQVLVTTRNVTAGQSLDSSVVSFVKMPPVFVPTDALTSLPEGATVRIALTTRTALTNSMILTNSGSIPIPQGWRGVAMPIDLVAPAVTPGDKVDIIVADKVVAQGALVVSIPTQRQGLTIAVPADVAAVVATAARNGEASLVVAN